MPMAYQKRKGRCSAVCWLAEGIRKMHGGAAQAIFQHPFGLTQFILQLRFRQLAHRRMCHGMRSESYSLAGHGPNLLPSQHPIFHFVLRQGDLLFERPAVFPAAMIWKSTEILDGFRSRLQPRLQRDEREEPGTI